MKKITFLALMIAAAVLFAVPAVAGLSSAPSDEADYVFGDASAGYSLTNGTPVYSSAINLKGLGGPLGLWIDLDGTGSPQVKIAYQVSTNSSNTVAAYGYPEGISWIVETLTATTVQYLTFTPQNLGWVRIVVFPIAGTSPKITVKAYRPTADPGGDEVMYPISTTACTDAAIAGKGGKLIVGAVLTRVVNSATDTTVKVRDGTSGSGTQYLELGLQSTEGSVSVMFPRPIKFSTGVYADFDVTTKEACIQLYEVKSP